MSTVPDWIVIAGTLAAILFGGGGVFSLLKWLRDHKVKDLATAQKDILRRLEAVENAETARAVLLTDAFKRERECFELVRSQLESAHNALQNASHDYPRFRRQGDTRMQHVAKTVSSLLHYVSKSPGAPTELLPALRVVIQDHRYLEAAQALESGLPEQIVLLNEAIKHADAWGRRIYDQERFAALPRTG